MAGREVGDGEREGDRKNDRRDGKVKAMWREEGDSVRESEKGK